MCSLFESMESLGADRVQVCDNTFTKHFVVNCARWPIGWGLGWLLVEAQKPLKALDGVTRFPLSFAYNIWDRYQGIRFQTRP